MRYGGDRNLGRGVEIPYPVIRIYNVGQRFRNDSKTNNLENMSRWVVAPSIFIVRNP
jgi:hypothetical protein